MLSYTEDVKIISSFHKISKKYGKIESRKTHGFIFRIKGCAEYSFDGKSIILNEGQVIFLPKGAKYDYTTNGDTLYTSINFEASFTSTPEISVFSIENFHGAEYINESFSELFKFGAESDKLKCLSILYDLLSYFLRQQKLSIEDKNKYELIEPAVEYLKKRIYDPECKIENLPG